MVRLDGLSPTFRRRMLPELEERLRGDPDWTTVEWALAVAGIALDGPEQVCLRAQVSMKSSPRA